MNLCNNIMVMEHLDKLVSDMSGMFGMENRVSEVREELIEFRAEYQSVLNKGGRVDMEMLYGNLTSYNDDQDTLLNESMLIESKRQLQWIYQSKILDRIQLKPLQIDYFNSEQSKYSNLLTFANHTVIQSITYLAISFYCYSTEVRFVEKTIQQQRNSSHEQRNNRTINHHHNHHNRISPQDDILQSQHWLSRSLEIAYSFLPPNAPILNQILTVHDRFHSIGKQTIHEDKQVCGYFKVLKSLSKPKSTYSSQMGIGHNCAMPIMIRVQGPKKNNKLIKEENNNNLWKIIQDDCCRHQQQNKRLNSSSEQSKHSITNSVIYPTTIDISSFTKNNKIKGLTTRIKILQFTNDTTTTKSSKQKQNHQKVTNNKTTLNFDKNNNINHHHNQTQYVSKNKSVMNKRRELVEIAKQTPRSARQFDNDGKTTIIRSGRGVISQNLLFRPHSFDNKNTIYNNKTNLHSNFSQSIRHSTKKRRSLSQNSRVNNKQKLEKILYDNSNGKFQGLKLTGKKLSDNFQIDKGLREKLNGVHSGVESQQILPDNALCGNIFINNNINLFISKPASSSSQQPKTTRQQLSTRTQLQTNLDMGKRLKFMTQRRFHLLNTQDNQPSEL